MNGLVLDASALLTYASGASLEPGAMLLVAQDDPDHQVWIPALSLGQAQLELTNTAAVGMLDLLLAPSRGIQVAVYDGPTSRRVARLVARFGITFDVAHAIATAVLYRCYLVTAVPKAYLSAARAFQLEILDITELWD